jgi:hypothetical protein
MEYLIKPYVERGFDFSSLFPEKQEQLSIANYDFNLPEVVKFLQTNTNNFTVENRIALDLDEAIYKLIQKQGAQMPMPIAEPIPAEPAITESEEEERGLMLATIKGIITLQKQGLAEQEDIDYLESLKLLLSEADLSSLN